MRSYQFLIFLTCVIGIVLGNSQLRRGKLNLSKNPLKKAIQFYRAEGIKPNHDSVEPDSFEHQPIQSQRQYRLDLSNGKPEIVQEEVEHAPDDDSYENSAPIKIEDLKIPEIKPSEIKFEKNPEIEEENEVDQEIGSTVSSILFDTEQDSTELEKSDLDDGPFGCDEGDVKKIDCNTCVCSNGNFICSHANCAEKKKFKVKNRKNSTISSASSGGDDEVDSDGVTTLAPDCADGITRQIDCNQCVCALGRWGCTKRSCIALTLREKASYKNTNESNVADTLKENPDIDEDCSEGETRMLGCNYCVCNWNSFSCTDHVCPPAAGPNKTHVYEDNCAKEGDIKGKECNLCECKMGVWVCSTNDCQKLGVRRNRAGRKLLSVLDLKDEVEKL